MSGFTEEEFTGFARKHYRTSDGSMFDACKAHRDTAVAVSREHMEFAKGVGGCGVYPGSTANVGNGTPINAVIFETPLPDGWKPRRSKSFSGLTANQTPAWPDQRSKSGKQALAKIAQLPFKPNPDDLCKAIGFPTSLSYSNDQVSGSACLGFFEVATIGWIGDVFYVSLPDFAGHKAKYESDGYTVAEADWTMSEGVEQILKEEVALDYARARLAKAAKTQG